MLNLVILEGRLTRDIAVVGEEGKKVGFLSIACERDFKNKEGNRDTDFISVKVFGKKLEFAEKYFHKGNAIRIEGAVRTFAKEVDGKNITVTEIVARDIAFPLTEKRGEAVPAQDVPAATDGDDDLPF